MKHILGNFKGVLLYFLLQALCLHIFIFTNVFIFEFMKKLISLESLKFGSLTTAGFTLKLQ